MNVVDNALQFTPKSGEIACNFYQSNKELIIDISNTGTIIEADSLMHIFDRFFRVDPARSSGHGSGLNLAMTKRIVELHHGTIKAYSTHLQTLFQIKLPLA
jgi:signal transduction histidine kinase